MKNAKHNNFYFRFEYSISVSLFEIEEEKFSMEHAFFADMAIVCLG